MHSRFISAIISHLRLPTHRREISLHDFTAMGFDLYATRNLHEPKNTLTCKDESYYEALVFLSK